MRTEKQIIEVRAAAYQEMKRLMNTASEEKRAMSAEEQLQWERAEADISAFTKELDMVRKAAGIESDLSEMREQDREEMRALPLREQDAKKTQYEAYFERLFNGPEISLSEAMRLAKTDGATRTQVATTAGNAAYIVPEEFIRMLEIRMKAFGGMFQVAYKHRSSKGGTMNWPTLDNTTQTGEWVDEPRNTGITPRGFTFGRIQFNAYTWTLLAQLTWEFIQDEDVSFVSSVLADQFGEAAGRALNKAYTDGDGSGKPTGILAASGGASSGKETAANNAIVKTEFIDLVHSVDPAYRNGPNVAFMFHDDTLARIRKLDFGTTDDEPIWQPSLAVGQPDRILGYPYVINQDFPTFAASVKLAAFGDWSKYVIRQVQDFSMVRLNERFADQLSTGFLGWLRVDGKLLQTNAIKLLTVKA